MKQKIWKWLRCYVSFESSGGLSQSFFNACAQKGLLIQSIKATKTGFCAETSAADYLKMHKIARGCRCRLRVKNKIGWRYTYKRFLGRIGIPIGAAVFCVILFAFPHLLWSIKFYNFTPSQEAQLRQSLYEKGVYEGCFISHAELERLEKQVFAENDDYGNLALNLFDGRITAEKRDASKKPEIISKEISNVVAACDGIVKSWDVMNGFVSVKVNQSVVKGQVLVSGVGFGRTGQPYYLPASGKVIAETEMIYEATQPLSVECELPLSDVSYSYKIDGVGLSFKLGKEVEAEHQTITRYPLSVFDFVLPFTVTETQTREYAPFTVTYTPTQAADTARARIYSELYTNFPDAEIITKSETIENEENAVKVSVKFTFTADIAKTVPFGGV